jgi:hypothetical protein
MITNREKEDDIDLDIIIGH